MYSAVIPLLRRGCRYEDDRVDCDMFLCQEFNEIRPRNLQQISRVLRREKGVIRNNRDSPPLRELFK